MISHPFGSILFAAFLTGCSKSNTTTTDSVTNSIASEEIVIHPDTFESSIGGFLGASYRVELQSDGLLFYQHNPKTFTSAPGTKSKRIKVTGDQWRDFRKALNEANVWTWKKDDTNPNVSDGTQWNLGIKYTDASVISNGSNAFPPNRDFERFRTAVVKLLGGHEFQ